MILRLNYRLCVVSYVVERGKYSQSKIVHFRQIESRRTRRRFRGSLERAVMISTVVMRPWMALQFPLPNRQPMDIIFLENKNHAKSLALVLYIPNLYAVEKSYFLPGKG